MAPRQSRVQTKHNGYHSGNHSGNHDGVCADYSQVLRVLSYHAPLSVVLTSVAFYALAAGFCVKNMLISFPYFA
jgi:hypothetical protein